ncbi:hypothetical protein B0T19DRAFT_436475 [Cercophora scortea]|uniref:SET domain-containing protein n=1 Tax=Cercophora scortea TaxID=314031 RepID=A0AAE0MK74_9PEZI|nr:hypothetical protein B0T19DRAFT_436475 [Cercophora scortea]
MADTPEITPEITPAESSEGFDALKQGKPPAEALSPAPLDEPAVRVGLVNPAIGYGLFAARDFSKGEFIFTEAPLMSGLFNETYAEDGTLIHSQHQSYRAALADSRFELNTAFPLLAARNGFPPLPFDTAQQVLNTTLGKNLVHGRLDTTTVSPGEYESYVTRFTAAVNPSDEDSRRAAREFFRHYAFQVQGGSNNNAKSSSNSSVELAAIPGPSSVAAAAAVGLSALGQHSTNEACIYLLGSLINHCCRPSSSSNIATEGPNCGWRIGPSGLVKFIQGPRHIGVEARRDIAAGEQLTWDYNKRDKGFICVCETCRRSWVGHYCKVL